MWTCAWEYIVGVCTAGCSAYANGSLMSGPMMSHWPTRWRREVKQGKSEHHTSKMWSVKIVLALKDVEICAKGVVHPNMKTCWECVHPQAFQNVDAFVFWFHHFKHFITCSPCSVVNGCRPNETKHLIHLHLVILLTLLYKATYNWGIHKAIHLAEANRQRMCL